MAFVTVQGTVGRTFFDGRGAEVVESWESRGETHTKRWSAFFEEPHGLVEGDRVEVSGQHSDKVDTWEKDGQSRHAVKRTINRAKVKNTTSAAAGSPYSEVSAPDAYSGGVVASSAQTGAWDAETPF